MDKPVPQRRSRLSSVVRQLETFEESQEHLRLMLGKQHALALRGARLAAIDEAELRVFSQFGDDGIIQYLVQRVAAPTSFVEFGVSNYMESNTRFLLMNNNWRGLVMDGNPANMDHIRRRPWFWRYDLTTVAAFIDRDNINDLIQSNGFGGEVGLLHIDLDGNDYWIFSALTVIDPVIVILEYNSVFGCKHAVTVPYDPNFRRTEAHSSNLYFGASLIALAGLADQRGYCFVGSNSAGNNAYFVRKDRVGDLPQPGLPGGYVESRFRESRDVEGKLSYLSGPDRLKAIQDKKLFDVTAEKTRLIRDIYEL